MAHLVLSHVPHVLPLKNLPAAHDMQLPAVLHVAHVPPHAITHDVALPEHVPQTVLLHAVQSLFELT